MIPSNSAPHDGPLLVWLRLLALILAGASLALVFRSAGQVFSTPFTEDGYYSLSVARSIAQGLGFTIDGVHETNGFQPLFTLIEALGFWLAQIISPESSDVLAMRLVTLAAWIFYIGTALCLGSIAANLDEPRHAALRKLLAITLYLGAFLVFMHHFNGLETGLQMFLLALLWRAHQLALVTHVIGRLVIGLLLGLLVLTRIDMAIFVAIYCLVRTIFAGALLNAHQRKRRFGQRLLEASQIGLVAIIIAAPWFVYNYLHFGSIIPSSGLAQMMFELDERRMRWIIWAMGATILPNLWMGIYDEIFHDGIILSILRGIVIFIGLIGFYRAVTHRGGTIYRAGARFGVEFGLILFGAMMVISVYYALNFVSFWFYYRYLLPFALLSLVALAWMAAPPARKQRIFAGFIVTCLAVPTLVSAFLAQQGRSLHVETVYWSQLALVQDNVPERYKVGAGQSGTLGFFRPNIVNLDGKVNVKVLPYHNNMDEYLRKNDIEWICDWPNYVELYLGSNPQAKGWQLVDTTTTSYGLVWQLWHRVDPDPNPTEK